MPARLLAAACGLCIAASASAEPAVASGQLSLAFREFETTNDAQLGGATLAFHAEFDTTDAATISSGTSNFVVDARVVLSNRTDGAPTALSTSTVSAFLTVNNASAFDRYSFTLLPLDLSILGLPGVTAQFSTVQISVSPPTIPGTDPLPDATIFETVNGLLNELPGSVGLDGVATITTPMGSDSKVQCAQLLEITLGPKIIAHPTNALGDKGDQFQLTALVLGDANATHQWKRNGVALVDDGRISGATTETLTIDDARLGDTGSYTLEVTDISGTIATQGAIVAVNQTCPADVNDDGTATPADFTAWLAAFSAGCP